MSDQPVLIGRSSSHFTRVARMMALELEVAHVFRPLLDLMSVDPSAYAGNPALKIPVFVDEEGPLFGVENICRALVARSTKRPKVVLRGEVGARVVANAEELTLLVMSTEVTVVMAKVSGGVASPKAMPSIENALDHLDAHIDRALAALPPDRTVSFLEVALFCGITHLPFRQVLDVSRWRRLEALRARIAERPSAQATAYRFDAA
jgi:glutathione S-transferase